MADDLTGRTNYEKSPDHEPTSWGWLFTLADGSTFEAYFAPFATRARALATYPEALDAVPIEEPEHGPRDTGPAIERDLEEINAWLLSIGETDKGLIAEVLDLCARHRETREGYLRSAREELTR